MSNEKQYDSFASDFSDSVGKTLISRNIFYEILDEDLNNKNLLDVACGDGTDLTYYQGKGAQISGVDASEELVEIANSKFSKDVVKVGRMEDLPYEDNSFDLVVSKYALQTSKDLKECLMELARVAKSGATILYLTVHPIRQFLEKKEKYRDYYEQEEVRSVLFKGEIVATELSHTFSEYFDEDVLKKMKLTSITEESDFSDTSAQQVGGDYYPTFMVCKFVKI
ncbi:MAG: methyltransferase domain-containing protein [Candidatus Paceibacterota bacterium]